MTCPECGKDSYVVDSRRGTGRIPVSSHKIRRRRECLNGHRFNTVEAPQVATPREAVLERAQQSLAKRGYRYDIDTITEAVIAYSEATHE